MAKTTKTTEELQKMVLDLQKAVQTLVSQSMQDHRTIAALKERVRVLSGDVSTLKHIINRKG